MSVSVHVGIIHSLIRSVTGDLALADALSLTSAADALTHVADALTQTLLPSDTLTNPRVNRAGIGNNYTLHRLCTSTIVTFKAAQPTFSG